MHYASGLRPRVRLWPIDIHSNARLDGEVEIFLPAEMLVVDLPDGSRLRGGMEKNKKNLVNQLATRAGMLMEDYSVVAITLTGRPEVDMISTIQDLEAQLRKMASLLEAARTLCE